MVCGYPGEVGVASVFVHTPGNAETPETASLVDGTGNEERLVLSLKGHRQREELQIESDEGYDYRMKGNVCFSRHGAVIATLAMFE